LLRKPGKIGGMEWDSALQEFGWRKAVMFLVRDSLERGQRRRRQFVPRSSRAVNLDALEVGSVVKGKVTALTAYGAFVDIGASTEGLVHISEMADSFVKDPATVLQAGQEVEARVLSVDIEKQRFRLSLRSEGEVVEEDHSPSYVRSTRPKGGGAGGRHGGPGGRGGGRDRQDGGGRRRKGEKLPPDPRRAKKEEIDPTNPFFVFFNTDDK
jgi:predicted RNA-binding protein with RPS1 domain